MTPVCFRLDLDSTPWDASSGYGVEQARLVALFDFARRSGVKFHVFASSRALRAAPGLVDAVLGDGHDLDWLFAGPFETLPSEWDEAARLLVGTGHTWWGVGLTDPFSGPAPSGPRFLSAPEGPGVIPWGEGAAVATHRFSLAEDRPEHVVSAVLDTMGSGRKLVTLREVPGQIVSPTARKSRDGH